MSRSNQDLDNNNQSADKADESNNNSENSIAKDFADGTVKARLNEPWAHVIVMVHDAKEKDKKPPSEEELKNQWREDVANYFLYALRKSRPEALDLMLKLFESKLKDGKQKYELREDAIPFLIKKLNKNDVALINDLINEQKPKLINLNFPLNTHAKNDEDTIGYQIFARVEAVEAEKLKMERRKKEEENIERRAREFAESQERSKPPRSLPDWAQLQPQTQPQPQPQPPLQKPSPFITPKREDVVASSKEPSEEVTQATVKIRSKTQGEPGKDNLLKQKKSSPPKSRHNPGLRFQYADIDEVLDQRSKLEPKEKSKQQKKEEDPLKSEKPNKGPN